MCDADRIMVLLWCCESWLLTHERKQLLQTTQNAMLRRIAGPRRRPDETWVDWVQRSTRKALARARGAGIRLWPEAYLQSKWCWAGHVLRVGPERIARRSVEWRDSQWQASEYLLPARLRIRRPWRKRWFRRQDDLTKYAKHCGWESWQTIAQQRDSNGQASHWLDHCKAFAEFIKK